MSWEQVTAIASVGSACILAVASAAAIVQLRHARNANRLTAYLMLFEQGNSPAMLAARLHLANMDLSEPDTVERALDDPQFLMAGNHIQATCVLVRGTSLPDSLLYPMIAFAARVWPKLAPIARDQRDYTGRLLRTYPGKLREEIEADMAAGKIG